MRERAHEESKEAEKLKESDDLPQKELAYDSGEEKKKRKKNSKEYARYQEERKRMRDKESEDDIADREKEQQELLEIEKRRQDEFSQ